MLLQIFRQNFYSNASCFSLGNSQVSVYRTIGPTLVLFFFKECIERASENSERFAKSSENQLIDELNSV